MWIVFAIGSALFAGLNAILAKLGIRKTDSTLATALRTIVVVLFAWLMVFITHAQSGLADMSFKTFLFLILSGLATGASWLCYFKAIQTGPVAQVATVDKSSTVLTIVLAFVLLKETVSAFSAAGVVLIGLGTFLMLDPNPFAARLSGQNKSSNQETNKIASSCSPHWIWFAIGAAAFASLSAITGKIGIDQIDSNLGTAIRTLVVLVMAWLMVFITHKQKALSAISRKEMAFILLSGVATGASWLCYYRALHTGPASAVVSIDKLSILVTVAFSVGVLHEKLSWKSGLGLAVQTIGTLLMLL